MEHIAYHCSAVSKRYADDSEFELRIDALDLPADATIAVIGCSGSGKTTLLNLLGDLERPDRGQIVFHPQGGVPIIVRDSTEYRRRLGFVFQEPYLLSNASVALNVAMPACSRGLPTEREVLASALEQAGLPDPGFLDRRAWELSGGQKQRVTIARALACRPEVILADEPSSSLDPEMGLRLMTTLCNWRSQAPGRTVVWVTHHYEQAAELADWVIVLHAGRPITAAPIPNPRSADQLRSWVTGAARPDVASTPTAAQPVAGGAAELEQGQLKSSTDRHGWSMMAIKHALCELTSRPAGIAGRKRRDRIVRWTSIGAPMQTASLSPLPWFGQFAHATQVFLLFWVLALAMLCVSGQQMLGTYFAHAVEDVGIRHVIVAANIRKQQQLTQKAVADLGRQPWRPVQAGTDPPKGGAVFGRMAETLSVAPVTLEGATTINGLNFQVLYADPSEPVFSKLPLLTGDSVGTLQPGEKAIASLLYDAPPYSVVLSRSALTNQLGLKDDDPVPAKVYVISDDTRMFTVLGVVDELPSDQFYIFDAFISNQDKLRLLASGPQAGSKLINSMPVAYDRVAIYFDVSDLRALEKFLSGKEYIFSRDNMKKLERTIDMAKTIGNLAYWIIACVIAFVVFLTTTLIVNYIKEHRKALGVLKAYGVGFREIGTMVALLALADLAIAGILSTTAVIMLWPQFANVLANRIGLPLSVLSVELPWLAGALIAASVLSAITVLMALAIWWQRHRNVAELLKTA